MDTRLAAVKCLIKILEHNKTSDEVLNSYANKTESFSELVNLVSGTVKYKIKLDFFIENISSRKKISPPLKNILRSGIYELEFLRTPNYAVINSYVNLAKQYDKNSSGFVNAVLRNFIKKRAEITEKIKHNSQTKAISIEYSHPEWLVEKWLNAYGIDETIKICEFNNQTPHISIRANILKSSKKEIIDLFEKNEIKFQESEVSEDCLILKNTGNIKNLHGYKEGLWIVQGEASSLAAKILEPQAGERVLDLCAAPGGKTAHIAGLTQDKGEIIAVDISKDRTEKIIENMQRLGITSVKTVIADAVSFNDNQEYDRILIDAPCSNTGVFIKRPDARWKRKPEDIKTLSELQLKILQNASTMVKNGGIIVYSTCSIESEENILVVQKFLENNKNFKFIDISEHFLWKHEGKEGFIQILQSKHNTDGFFIAKLQRAD